MKTAIEKTKSPGDRRSQSLSVLRRKPEDWKGGNRNPVRSGAFVAYVGGNANNAGNDGPGYVNVNNGLGNSNTNIGGRATKDFGTDSAFPHRRDWWIDSAHIRFSSSFGERAGLTSAHEVAA